MNEQKILFSDINEKNLNQIINSLRFENNTNKNLFNQVNNMLTDIKNEGLKAILKYTEKYDGVTLDPKSIKITNQEIRNAYKNVSKKQIQAIKTLKSRIELIENKILQKVGGEISNKDGVQITNKLSPIDSVGCYVPGGKAVYPSSVIMTVIPAKIAGVPRIAICSPPTKNKSIDPLLIVAADICGVNEIYKIGGVQAIGLMAYGTENVKPVDKIVGPGNAYVSEAKKQVSQFISIDCPAGPSEILILADDSAIPKWVARDLIAQAEHGETSVCGLLTTSTQLANKVEKELMNLIKVVPRSEYVKKSILNNGFILTSKKLNVLIDFINLFSPEHLMLITKKTQNILSKIRSAGLILLGNFTPVAASDYGLGSNHVLPTSGTAKTYSGLSVLDFIKRINIIKSNQNALKNIKNLIEIMAKSEDLPNHYLSIKERWSEK